MSTKHASLIMVAVLTCSCLGRAADGKVPPGKIQISVDATQVSRRILHATLVYPVLPGPMTLYYPKWMPADHSPDGPVWNMVGLKLWADGREVPWQQDDIDMYAFNVIVPEKVSSVKATLDFLISAPGPTIDFSASGAANLFILMWNQVCLYPKGFAAADLVFQPELTLPAGWKFSTALPVKEQAGNTISFSDVPLDLLIDSPVQAGEFMKVYPLSASGEATQELDVMSDDPWALDIPDDLIGHYKKLVKEAAVLYSSRHFRDYHFLFTLSDNVMELGQEHHESSDDRVKQHSIVDPAARIQIATLFPHEYSHSWNGQYRRPVGLATPDFQQPMKGELLWVYEGLTDYLGTILASRSGLLTPQQAHDQLALTASSLDHRYGRQWRSLQNTANAAQILYFSVPEWRSYRRGTDFYSESILIWLEVDTKIRQLTDDNKSMDDFCKVFYAGHDGEPVIKTYTFEDIVSTLKGIAPYDWARFFSDRLQSTAPSAPLGGITGGGWRLTYGDTPNEVLDSQEASSGSGDFTSSLGLEVRQDGFVIDAIPGMPAFASGISPYMKAISVNGVKFSVDTMRRAIQDSAHGRDEIVIETENANRITVHHVQYHGGSQFPHLERVSDAPNYLDEILQSKISGGSK